MPAEKRNVVMSDGRTLSFGKVEKVKKTITQTDGRPLAIRFDGDNGDTVVCDFADLPDYAWIELASANSISAWAMAHGYNQKLGDSYSGTEATVDCLETVRQLWGRLCKGQWQSDTRGFGASAVLLEAVMRAFPDVGRDKARALLADMSKAERLALQTSDTVKPHYDAIMAERAKGDGNALAERFKS